MIVVDSCPTQADLTDCTYQYAYFTTAFGSYAVDGHCGCHNPSGVPDMLDFCVDWNNNRARFLFPNQSKRCLQRRTRVIWTGGDCPNNFCNDHVFEEVGCTWREVLGEAKRE